MNKELIHVIDNFVLPLCHRGDYLGTYFRTNKHSRIVDVVNSNLRD